LKTNHINLNNGSNGESFLFYSMLIMILINKDIHNKNYFTKISSMNFDFSEKQKRFINQVDKVCKILRTNEETAYLKESINDKLVPEFNKIGMLGCPISKQYKGLGYDILTYILALQRIGEEGSAMRTFFSCHTSIGQLVLQTWSNDEQKKQYLQILHLENLLWRLH